MLRMAGGVNTMEQQLAERRVRRETLVTNSTKVEHWVYYGRTEEYVPGTVEEAMCLLDLDIAIRQHEVLIEIARDAWDTTCWQIAALKFYGTPTKPAAVGNFGQAAFHFGLLATNRDLSRFNAKGMEGVVWVKTSSGKPLYTLLQGADAHRPSHPGGNRKHKKALRKQSPQPKGTTAGTLGGPDSRSGV
jgi:hypothetical protein